VGLDCFEAEGAALYVSNIEDEHGFPTSALEGKVSKFVELPPPPLCPCSFSPCCLSSVISPTDSST